MMFILFQNPIRRTDHVIHQGGACHESRLGLFEFRTMARTHQNALFRRRSSHIRDRRSCPPYSFAQG